MNTMPNMITQAAGTVNRRAKSRLRTFRMLPTDTPRSLLLDYCVSRSDTVSVALRFK